MCEVNSLNAILLEVHVSVCRHWYFFSWPRDSRDFSTRALSTGSRCLEAREQEEEKEKEKENKKTNKNENENEEREKKEKEKNERET